MHWVPDLYVPLGHVLELWQELLTQEVPKGQIVVLVAHLKPSKYVPAGQLWLGLLMQRETSQNVPGGHWIGTHLNPSQVCPLGQFG